MDWQSHVFLKNNSTNIGRYGLQETGANSCLDEIYLHSTTQNVLHCIMQGEACTTTNAHMRKQLQKDIATVTSDEENVTSQISQ